MKKILLIITILISLTSFSKAYAGYNDLGATCYPSSTNANTGDVINWRASVYGGNGDYYITWIGTDGLSGSGSDISMRYYSGGTKGASVRVISNGQTISRNCSSISIFDTGKNTNTNTNYYSDNYYRNNYYNDYYNNNYVNRYYDNNYYNQYNPYNQGYNSPLFVSCTANTNFAVVGGVVSWQGYVTGGNGSYIYDWTGTDSIHGYTKNIEYYYNTPGVKTAFLNVRSGNQSVTQVCSNTITVGAPINTYNYQNQYNYPYQQYGNVYPVNQYQPANNPPVQTVVQKTESAPVTKTIIKYVEVPAKTVVKDNTVKKDEIVKNNTKIDNTNDNSLASLFSIKNVPWGLVAIMIIMVLSFIIFYLMFNSKKI